MYRFILGGSGSGKTKKAYSDCITAAIADESSHFLLIVPEQSTTAAEKEIVKMHERHATDNIDILSFNRLAYKVFDELEIVNPMILDDISKAMILRKLGSEHRDELKVWGGRFDRPGFIDNLKSMISELYLYGITAEDIRGRMPFSDRQLQNKMHDLCIIYEAFRNYISGRYVALEEIPDILASNIHNSSLIKNSTIILDGFTGFTPVQYRIIENFLCSAKEVVITVSIGEDRDSSLFDMSRDMINRIIDLASRNGINHGQDTILKTDSFLEKHLLRYDGARGKLKDSELRIVHAVNSVSEASFVAADIQRLIKTKGYRYRDLAVVCSDISAAKTVLSHEFEQSGIPCYFDESVTVGENALVLMIEAALDIIRTDYSYESVIRFLKSGLVTDDEAMSDAMDNYMFECGRRGYKRMSASWDYMPDDLKDIDREELNCYKNSILDKLEPLMVVFAQKKAEPCDIASALRGVLESNSVQEKLEMLAQEFGEKSDPERQREYSGVYECINLLLENIETLLEGEKLSCEEFRDVFLAGAQQIKLGMIPSGTDRVTIGDITRSRLDGVRVLYVMGANDGSIPKLLSRGNVITDAEKEKLKSAGFELSPTIKEDLLIQRYYLYRLLTKPSDQLVITYAGMDASGKELQPSYIINYLKGMYDNLEIEEAADIAELYDISAAVRRTGEMLRKLRVDGKSDDEKFISLYAYLIGDEKTRSRIELMTSAALYTYRHSFLSKESTDILYGDSLQGTISKLELFAECPYRYFASYGLGLKELEPFAFRAVDIGNIAHSALEKIFSHAQKLKIDLYSVTEEAREALVHRCIEQAIMDDEPAKYSDTAHNAYMVKRVERVVNRSLWGLLSEQDTGFRPYELEWCFGNRDRLKATEFDLGDGKHMLLSGKIDRTDIRSNENDIDVRVIDYKSGSKTWNLGDVINGRELQITLYMAAVKELLEGRFTGSNIVPQEMFYYTLRDPVVDSDDLEKMTLDEALLKQMKPAGVSSSDEIEKLIPYVREKARGMGKSITDGNIRIEPSYKDSQHNGCAYCKYKSVCGFDRKIEGFGFKQDKKINKEEAWQIITGQMNN